MTEQTTFRGYDFTAANLAKLDELAENLYPHRGGKRKGEILNRLIAAASVAENLVTGRRYLVADEQRAEANDE